LPEDRIAVEFRNRTWMSEDNRERTLAFLREYQLTYTCVDEPQGFVSSVPPIAAVTSDVALVRFHGRNAARWNRSLRTARERFEYRSSQRELAEWSPAIRDLAEHAEQVHVVMNNCYANYAVENAEMMQALLTSPAIAPAAA